jgi:hypothetical protein
MSRLLEFLRVEAVLAKAEWVLLLVVFVLVCVLLHPRILRARTWGARAQRPSPPQDERIDRGRYRRRSG